MTHPTLRGSTGRCPATNLFVPTVPGLVRYNYWRSHGLTPPEASRASESTVPTLCLECGFALYDPPPASEDP